MRTPVSSEKSQAILRAAIEAGTVQQSNMTIVIVIDKDATVDIASVAPSMRAAAGLPMALVVALDAINGVEPELAARIEVAKS